MSLVMKECWKNEGYRKSHEGPRGPWKNGEDGRAKISSLSVARWKDEAYRKRQEKVRRSKRWREAHSMSQKAKWANKVSRGKLLKAIRSPECSKKKSNSMLALYTNPDYLRKHSKRTQKIWDLYTDEQRSSRIRKALKVVQARPNVPEKKLDSLLKKNFPGEFKLNVSGDVIMGGYVPDFVNVNGKKLFVEMFGTYWHGKSIKGRDKKEEESHRKRHFKKWGFSTVVVWEEELKAPEAVVRKVEIALGRC